MSALFGGGSASKDAEKARALQQVANDRQLASLTAAEQKQRPSRKAPRGRRLFETIGQSDLSATLGG